MRTIFSIVLLFAALVAIPVFAAMPITTLHAGDRVRVVCADGPLTIQQIDAQTVEGSCSAPTATATATATILPPTATTRPPTPQPPTATALPPTALPPTPTTVTGGIAAPNAPIWLTSQELQALPTSGPAWDQLVRIANGSWGSPQISNQDSQHDTNTLAGALVAARTNNSALKAKVRDAILAARETENGGRVLALARNLPSYVLAADVINLAQYDSAADQQFRRWLADVRTEAMTECTNVIACQEKRPNNWGTHSAAARIAADLYLQDQADLQRAITVFKGYLGDRASYAGFAYGDLSWQADPANPVGINPKGATKQGYDVDGVIPDDQRRCGSFAWPPCKENYAYENLQGVILAADLLQRNGYSAFEWQDRAILRAATWLNGTDAFPAAGDDLGTVWAINRWYGTAFPTNSPAPAAKNVIGFDWVYGR